MDKEPTFAQEIQALAREINDSNLEDNSSMNQSNYDSSKGYQVKADTVGHIGDVINNP
ncbi:hypothetical protein [Coleofasciculus sp. FACHB-SPT9]|uniref:hypothetical protein n=1 Tax=Cyanophyceae TaxID=3028117 RepID=UPI00168A3B63|nr:hypothetical protein [Coleofasciculus sp. FACHB-SPT9]MBD1888473.1 hypothetical protein [Coleofasciculus sp. FACHB-SPT9]